MQSPSWFTERPAGPIRAGVVFLVALAAIAAVWRFPSVLADLAERASGNSALSYTDREIAGGNEVVADQRAVYEARARIPSTDTYHVAVGDGFVPESPLTVPYVASYYRSFLVPRRAAETAPWVVCYGCDLAAYGPGAEVVWTNGAGISIVRLPR